MKKLVVLATVGVMMACVTGCTSPVTSPIEITSSSQMQKFENPQTGEIEWVELEVED